MNQPDSRTAISRRTLIQGAAALGVGASMGACATSAIADTVAEAIPDEQIDCDIVVVGAGNSGLAATVQAAELGAKVVLLEVNATQGMNTEGLFAVNSHYQQEQGIGVTMSDVIAKEESFFNYRVNALFWKDLIKNSADMVDWLEGHGVKFSGQVDNYYHLGHIPVFHWFEDGLGSNLTGPLLDAAVAMGVDVRFETRGMSLVTTDGAVTGIVAEDLVGGRTLQFNAKAVILATGGFLGDLDRMASLGIPAQDVVLFTPGRVGDGINMAVAIGAKDRSAKACFLREGSFLGKGWLAPLPDFAIYSGVPIWVNEDGERFATELCAQEASGCVTNAHYTQKRKFALWGAAAYDGASDEVKAGMDEAQQGEGLLLYKFDSLDELADTCGFDAAVIKETVETYNGYCANGVDEEFAKDASALVSIEAPYYIGEFRAMNMQSIGGIAINRNAQVLDVNDEPIAGLYAVGTDSCMLYGETYTISVPASCNGNNINTGRTAAKHAVATL